MGFSLPGGQISAKGGNLVVHIYASGFLPKHYPGGSGFNLQSLEGRAWRVRGWKTVSVRAVLCCSQVGMYIYIYGPYMYISHRNLGIERSSSIQVRGCHSFFATSSLRPPRVSLYVQFGSDRKLLRCQPWRVLSVVDWLISLRGGGRVTHVSASGSLKRGPPPHTPCPRPIASRPIGSASRRGKNCTGLVRATHSSIKQHTQEGPRRALHARPTSCLVFRKRERLRAGMADL